MAGETVHGPPDPLIAGESVWGQMLFETQPRLAEHMRLHNALLTVLMRESAEARERDVAWLASLSPARRALELGRRRLRRDRRRAERWLEEYVTFRFARRRPNEDDW